MAIKALFCDLDQTLAADSQSNLLSLKQVLPLLSERFSDLDEEHLTATFFEINNWHWRNYDESPIGSMIDIVDVRAHIFSEIFKALNWDSDDAFAFKVAEAFQAHRLKTYRCYEDSLEVLAELHTQLPVVLVTNGNGQMQRKKVDISGLKPYLHSIFIAQEVGISKPLPGIFEKALHAVQAKPSEVLMVGDNPDKDILGAKAAGLKTAWIRRNEEFKSKPDPFPDYYVKDMFEVKKIIENLNGGND